MQVNKGATALLPANTSNTNSEVVSDIRRLINQSRTQAAAAVNAELTLLYWRIGQRIKTEVLQDQRAGYGEQMLLTVLQQLESEYGRGFSMKSLRDMVRFAEVLPSFEIVSTLSRQLTWSHFAQVIEVKKIVSALGRQFKFAANTLNGLLLLLQTSTHAQAARGHTNITSTSEPRWIAHFI